jgi:hypothetical protein
MTGEVFMARGYQRIAGLGRRIFERKKNGVEQSSRGFGRRSHPSNLEAIN